MVFSGELSQHIRKGLEPKELPLECIFASLAIFYCDIEELIAFELIFDEVVLDGLVDGFDAALAVGVHEYLYFGVLSFSGG